MSLLPKLLPALLLARAALAAGEDPALPYVRYTLENGLTLLVHEDHKAPLVAVNVWYHVGSKDERPGKTGFAHLFEHLMFNGSEHFNDDFFKATERIGATELNGTTGRDRTNYFANAPKEALDVLLWLESDRMGHLLGAVTQDRLDEQRGVVLNELRQYENQPYALAYRLITRNTWPAGHPYAWPVIGEAADLEAATLDDVRTWFKTFYGPANATLVVAGDVEPAAVHEAVRRHFGALPPGPPVSRHKAWIAKRSGTRRQVAQDRVPQARLYKVWNIPPYGTAEGTRLELAAAVLADSQTSRLYRRLVREERLATEVSADADLDELAGQFFITATAAPGADLARLERALDEELARLLEHGPDRRELARVQAQAEAALVRGTERIGGFGGKADLLARDSVLLGRPDHHKVRLREIRETTRRSLRDTARDWLADGAYVLEVQPFEARAAAFPDVDRSRVPAPEIRPEARFPELRRARLANGLTVLLAERPGAPVVQLSLLLDVGSSADAPGASGTARLTLDLLAEGTRRRSGQELSDALALLGAHFSTACGLDTCTVSLNTLRRHLDPALDLYADALLNPLFPEAEFVRLQTQRLAEIRHAQSGPATLAHRLLPALLFGPGHPYGAPDTGTEETVGRLTPADLARFHAAWFRPERATLAVAGDVTPETLLPALERRFGAWRPAPAPAAPPAAPPAPETAPALYLVDRPGAAHSLLLAGCVAPPRDKRDELAVGLMNRLLGGAFTSRINLNLREEKRWTYGARTALAEARGPRPFWASASVQADKTAAAIREVDRELRGPLGPRPFSDAEVAAAVRAETLRLAGAWETVGSVADALVHLSRAGLPDDAYQTLPARLQALTREPVNAAAARVVRPERAVWLVVGDRARLEPELRALAQELGLGPLRPIDASGRPLP